MKIVFLGKFNRLHDEEYIARSFEMLGHDVLRLPEQMHLDEVFDRVMEYRPKFVLYCKLNNGGDVKSFREKLRAYNIKTVSWVFDLYFGYPREYRLREQPFKADYLFTTDGGNQEKFEALGLNHQCVRQGIYKEECFMAEGTPQGIVFVGSENALNQDRHKALQFIEKTYPEFTWYGRSDTNEIRGTKLNTLYANTKVVIGDSVYSPYYWSNRVVETLGRGGFLIHREVPGLKEEYPHLVTYDGTLPDLKAKIDYYLSHDAEREKIRKKNFEWVKDKYTMDKKCEELIKKL